jgi:hypothetical protein
MELISAQTGQFIPAGEDIGLRLLEQIPLILNDCLHLLTEDWNCKEGLCNISV